MEDIIDHHSSESKLALTQIAKDHILATGKWGKFLAILGFILTGIMVIAAFTMILGGSALNSVEIPGMPNAALGGFGMIGFVYLIMALIYGLMSYWLFNFSSKSTQGIHNNSNILLEDAFKSLKNIYKTMGIFAIIYISFIVLALTGALVFGAAFL